MTFHSNKNQLRYTHCGSGTLQGNGCQKPTLSLGHFLPVTLHQVAVSFFLIHQGWCLNSTVAYHLAKHHAVLALAPVTFTNVWAEAENK